MGPDADALGLSVTVMGSTSCWETLISPTKDPSLPGSQCPHSCPWVTRDETWQLVLDTPVPTGQPSPTRHCNPSGCPSPTGHCSPSGHCSFGGNPGPSALRGDRPLCSRSPSPPHCPHGDLLIAPVSVLPSPPHCP